MRRNIILASISVLAACACGKAPEVSLQMIGTGYAKTTANTCVFRGSSIASDSLWRVTAFYDEESFVNIAWQRQGYSEWDVTRTRFQGKTSDAHNVISVAIDGNGFLHMAFSMHSSPLNYCRSLRPYSSQMGDLEPMIGDGKEDRTTYPEFHRLSGGDLLFFYRHGSSGQGDLVLNRYSIAECKWTRVHDSLVDGEGERNAYPQMFVDSKDNIHLSWVWRETPKVETNHDMCYAYSDDAGVSWKKTDGSLYQMPVTSGSAEYAFRIPQGSELINQTSMTADSNGRPYIATYWRDNGSSIPQYRLIWFDGTKWQMRQVGTLTREFALAGGGTKKIPISRPQVALANDGVHFIFRAEEFGSVVSDFHTESLDGNSWKRSDLTGFSVESWEPTLDKDALRRGGPISIFVQTTLQGDGEKTAECEPQPVYIMDMK